jgi:hypothetical protein
VSGFVLQRWFSKKEKMLDGVLGGYCRVMENLEYMEVLSRRWKWSCVIDLVDGIKRGYPPFLESLLKMFYKSF